MNNKLQIGNLGENRLIKIIEKLVLKETGKVLLRDDSFFFYLKDKNSDDKLVLNSDMLVSTTDVPPHMNYFQIGRKAVLMNLSDLIVKGVKPRGIIISLGLFKDMLVSNFKELIMGIVDYCIKWNLDYVGGDLNETKELIINPTVFGFGNHSKIIYRNGLNSGDFLIANGKFGLTGVGFDILLNEKGDYNSHHSYRRSIMSVLEPNDLGLEAFILTKNNFAMASIDSSDGLAKSLMDLIDSNPNKNVGFEINFDEELIDKEARNYSVEFDFPLENLIFVGGEEFIHLFTVDPRNFDSALKAIQAKKGKIFKIGRVIPDKKIFVVKDEKNIELKSFGYEHFRKDS